MWGKTDPECIVSKKVIFSILKNTCSFRCSASQSSHIDEITTKKEKTLHITHKKYIFDRLLLKNTSLVCGVVIHRADGLSSCVWNATSSSDWRSVYYRSGKLEAGHQYLMLSVRPHCAVSSSEIWCEPHPSLCCRPPFTLLVVRDTGHHQYQLLINQIRVVSRQIDCRTNKRSDELKERHEN